MLDFIKKLTPYNMMNYLLPGIVFCWVLQLVFQINLVNSNIVINFFLYYFIGMSISRVGSLIVEPILRAVKVINFESYQVFISSSKSDPKLEVLVEQSNVYRTVLAMFVLICFIYAYKVIEITCPVFEKYKNEVLVIGLLILYLLSYSKQVKFIAARVGDLAGKNSQEIK